MDGKDEDQILAELKGEYLDAFVYQFTQGDRTITSLSYTGIKEAIRRRGNYSIVDYDLKETDSTFWCIVKIHDNEKNIDALGVSEADKSKPFARVLAVNKAERNAYAKLIPAKFFAELIAEKLKSSKPINVTPPQPEKDVSAFPPTAQSGEMQTPKLPDTVCPKCGGTKGPTYPLCYNCHEEEKAT